MTGEPERYSAVLPNSIEFSIKVINRGLTLNREANVGIKDGLFKVRLSYSLLDYFEITTSQQTAITEDGQEFIYDGKIEHNEIISLDNLKGN